MTRASASWESGHLMALGSSGILLSPRRNIHKARMNKAVSPPFTEAAVTRTCSPSSRFRS